MILSHLRRSDSLVCMPQACPFLPPPHFSLTCHAVLLLYPETKLIKHVRPTGPTPFPRSSHLQVNRHLRLQPREPLRAPHTITSRPLRVQGSRQGRQVTARGDGGPVLSVSPPCLDGGGRPLADRSGPLLPFAVRQWAEWGATGTAVHATYPQTSHDHRRNQWARTPRTGRCQAGPTLPDHGPQQRRVPPLETTPALPPPLLPPPQWQSLGQQRWCAVIILMSAGAAAITATVEAATMYCAINTV